MTAPLAVFTYLVVWGVTILLVLPFSRPQGFSLKRALLWNTLLAAAVTLLIHLLLKSGWVSIRGAVQ